MKNKLIFKISICGSVAALYAVLTLILAPVGFGPVQFRLSEALCILPFFFPEAAVSLFVGCIISNLFTSNIIWLDIVFGSLATLIAGIITSKIKNKYLAPLPPVIVNAIIIGAVIAFSMQGNSDDNLFTLFAVNSAMLFLSEVVVCYGIGLPLIFALEKMNFGQKIALYLKPNKNKNKN